MKKDLDFCERKIKINLGKIKIKVYENELVKEIISYDKDLKNGYDKIHFRIKNQENRDLETAEFRINQLINFLDYNRGVEEFAELKITLENWKNEIINSFIEFDGKRLSNAISESSVRKIKDLKRVTHGFNNFPYFRARSFLIFSKKDPIKCRSPRSLKTKLMFGEYIF